MLLCYYVLGGVAYDQGHAQHLQGWGPVEHLVGHHSFQVTVDLRDTFHGTWTPDKRFAGCRDAWSGGRLGLKTMMVNVEAAYKLLCCIPAENCSVLAV